MERKSNIYHHGGHLRSIPEPHETKWPASSEPRIVRIDVSTFIGLSVGAKHYYASLKEEDNPIWNVDAWQTCWDHPEELKGKKFEKKDFTDRTRARMWVADIWNRHFNDGKHKAQFESHDLKKFFRNIRIGD